MRKTHMANATVTPADTLKSLLWDLHHLWEGQAEPFDDAALQRERKASRCIEEWVKHSVTLEAIAHAILASEHAERRWSYTVVVLRRMQADAWGRRERPQERGGWQPDSKFEHLIQQ